MLVDQSVVPSVDEITAWVDAIATAAAPPDGGLRSIRTGALFPAAASRFEVAGFHPVDVLALLELDLTGVDRHTLPFAPWFLRHDRGAEYRIRPLRPRDRPAASLVDRRAFGDPWGYTADDLADVGRATPRHRARAIRTADTVTAFAISGAAAGNGYLQRLAVDPSVQRHGQGAALVADAIGWMIRRRLRRATVNTGVGNRAALALYEATGFRPRPERLHVMQLDVRPPPLAPERRGPAG